jgi:hypothetical protein
MIEFAEFDIDESTGEFKLRTSPKSNFSLEVAMAELLALRARVADAEREAQLASLDSKILVSLSSADDPQSDRSVYHA